MNYEELKAFCNSLTTEQLQQEVHLSIVDSHAVKVNAAYVSKEDIYYEHGDELGNLQMLKEENPDDWEDVLECATICPKGTVLLISEG